MTEIITDEDRYPTLTERGRAMLKFLREHPAAPIFRNQSGNRLTASEVAAQRVFEQEILASQVGWAQHSKPEWLDDFVKQTCQHVPYFNFYSPQTTRFEDLPTISRADLAKDIAQFVPDNLPLERMMNFRTSGTSGHPLLIPSHPVVAARYLAFHKRALRRFGIELQYGSGQVGVVLLGFQRKCFTYVSVNPTMEESGLAKINLHVDDWQLPEDRAVYLNALAPEVYAGDPLSFAELLTLPLSAKPRALISVAMQLSTGLRAQLQDKFACPVLDVYSMNEAGPIAVYDPQVTGYALLQARMYVEVLDKTGKPVGAGEQGEITLTGGFNDYLPLLRYRTGDYARLVHHDTQIILRDLCGRHPLRYRLASGEWINNIDITHALAALAIPQYAVHQDAHGEIVLKLAATHRQHAEHASNILAALFGVRTIRVETLHAEDKVVQYTSDLKGART